MRAQGNAWVAVVVIISLAGFFAYQQIQKGNSQGAWIAGGIVAAVVILWGGYYVLRSMKGNLKLELSQKSVASGDPINGKLHITIKKPLHADRLYIALVGELEERRRSSSSSGGSSTSWVEFYRDEADVMVGQDLPAGYQQTADFEMTAPSEAHALGMGATIGKAGDEIENQTAKSLVKGIGSIASALGGKRRWRLITRLETKGVDLADSQKLHVSLKSV